MDIDDEMSVIFGDGAGDFIEATALEGWGFLVLEAGDSVGGESPFVGCGVLSLA